MSSQNSGSANICSISNAAQQELQQRQPQLQKDENPRILPESRSSSSLPQQPPAPKEDDIFAEILMNRSLYDPPRWGWTALGGIADVLSPHERSRRHSTCRAYRNKAQKVRKLKRGRRSGMSGGGTKSFSTATATSAHLKDPPSYSIAPPPPPRDNMTSSGPVVSEQNNNQSTTFSQPVSFTAPTTESSSESKTTSEPAVETTAKIKSTAVGVEGSTGERNDSIPSRHEQKRQDSPDENTGDKKQSPCDSDPTVQQDATTKMNIDELGSASFDQNSVLPQEQPRIDIGLEAIGISTNVLGMTIERQRQQQSTTETNNDNKKDQEDDNIRNTESNALGRRSKKHVKSKSSRRSGGCVAPRIKSKYDCHVRSLGISSLSLSNSTNIGCNKNAVDTSKSKMVLDLYAYHQGREGMEARDADTGELLFCQQVTDTNHDFDAPKSTFPIEIEFPLEDDDDDEVDGDNIENNNNNNNNNNDNRNSRNNFINGSGGNNNTSATAVLTGRSSKKKNVAMYREIMTWDLLDPNTPTPLAFAASIGNEYGLSFGQTMDLAARIDKQIERHVAETSNYREPIAIRENTQELTEIRKIGPIRQPYRYDAIIQTEKEGGTFKIKRESRGHAKIRSSSSAAGGPRQNRNGGSLASETVTTKVLAPPKKRDTSKINKHGSAPQDEASLDNELVDELLAEVKKRSTTESVATDSGSGVLKAEKNAICHICKKRVALGFHFSCSMKNHVYCEYHVIKRLELKKESGVYNYNTCPICTLTCECAKCIRKLRNVATVFKAKCIEQRKQLHDVNFPDILSFCKNVISTKELNRATDLVLDKKQDEIRRKKDKIQRQQPQESEGKSLEKEKSPLKSRTIQLAGQTMVPRPPLSDFPREICDGSDFDAISTGAYFTIYSAGGQRPVSDVPDAWLDNDQGTKQVPKSGQLTTMKNYSKVQEDGNVDYCHICKQPGHLILCDFCPRGFHQDCLRHGNQSPPCGDQWECFVCKKEKTRSDNDYLDGKESINAMSKAFLELDPTDERSLVGLEVLSIIHQMLSNLVVYDFGYAFNEPVDTSLVPGYKDIVKCPMDIGTICSKLINGDFAELLNGSFSMDDLLTKVLNDIELIWRNCIMFNVIGSSVARMAVVLRRRVKMICRQSIFDKLSDVVKTNVFNYARKFDDAWANGMTVSFSKEKENSLSSDTWKLSAIENLKPRSDLKFVVKPSNGRPIAILDAVSGRVVKVYSSVKSASKAVEIILKSGHRCEWNATANRTDLNVKLIAEKSRNDPNSLLFGYRWLFLDDLNDGKVTFLKTICDIVEMRHDQYMFVFRSIEEALSSSRLSKTLDIDDLRKKLADLARNGNWTEIYGVQWRRPVIPSQRRDSLKIEGSVISTENDFELGSDLAAYDDNLLSWKNCVFLKKDLVTDRNLVGFDSIELAHQDWMQTALSSPSFPASEAQTMENFKKYYLDGNRNVDGMIWQTVDGSTIMEQEGKKEMTTNENLADPMEIQDGEDIQNIRSELTDQGENIKLPMNGESKDTSSVNESLSSTNFAITNDDQQQQVALEHSSTKMTSEESPSLSRKRKHLDDKMEFPPSKEERLTVVFVE